MQTFLPYSDFNMSVRCLDNRRLGKQRVEAYQILKALLAAGQGIKQGWQNHPAVKMWRGYEFALTAYYNACVEEWVSRGYKNTMKTVDLPGPPQMPPWMGDVDFHASHRSNLLRKDRDHYSKFGWSEEDNLPYVWPKV